MTYIRPKRKPNLRACNEITSLLGIHRSVRRPRLPSASELGISYKQRYALITLRRLSLELVDGISYFSIKETEKRLAEMEGLIQEWFPEDWARIQAKRAIESEPVQSPSLGYPLGIN